MRPLEYRDPGVSAVTWTQYFHILLSAQDVIRNSKPLSSVVAPPLLLSLLSSQAAPVAPHARPSDSMSLVKAVEEEVEAPSLRRNHIGYYVDQLFC